MALRKGTPSEGSSRRAESFTYVSPGRGDKPWTAWAAAEPYWCQAHPNPPPTKPCLTWLTNKELPCVRCSPLKPSEWVGWLLLWRETDLRPCVVILRECVMDLVEGLCFKDYVEVSRADERGSSVAVRRCLRQKPWVTKNPLRKSPVDPAPTLLTMWRLNELTEWYRCTNAHSDTPMSQSKQKPTKAVDQFAPMMRAAARRAGFPDSPTETEEIQSVFGDALKSIEKRTDEVTKNGKHEKT